MKLSNRLKSLAGLVENNDIVADIGCDHALLDIYLVNNSIVPKCYASDINNLALESGIKNIKKYGLEDKINIQLDNGIINIPADINTLIISGMGASTIIKILNTDKINQIDKLIIQSNNDYFLLRKFITSNGFYISHESYIMDKGKHYINIVFKRGEKKYSLYELKYGPILMKGNRDYYNYLLNKNKQIFDNVPWYKIRYKLSILKDLICLKKLSK